MVELAKTDPENRFREITYNLTKDNILAPDWLDPNAKCLGPQIGRGEVFSAQMPG